MKRLLFILSLLMISLSNNAQSSLPSPRLQIEGVLKTNYQQIEEGTPIVINNFSSGKSTDLYGNKKRSSIYIVEAGKKKIMSLSTLLLLFLKFLHSMWKTFG
ncbi:MAG: hypothetical protein GX963_05805 [Bacteroidales bacterium]|nr:hypothetical protein [Bacteroidales bacterium]